MNQRIALTRDGTLPKYNAIRVLKFQTESVNWVDFE